ncbi:MAG: hypothetical protein IT563_20140 [Alphaproteobacteria bacterium]|nr:hypothetical protein [Alphaproteobacteria bacterium]
MQLPPLTGQEFPDRVSQLRTADLLVLAASRFWVAHYLDPRGTSERWREGFRVAGLEQSTAEAFDALFSAFAGGATRAICFHCPASPRLGDDEAMLIQAIAHLQRGRETPARLILEAWLAPAALRLALAHAQDIASAMADVGLRLPQRGLDSSTLADFFTSNHGLGLVH